MGGSCAVANTDHLTTGTFNSKKNTSRMSRGRFILSFPQKEYQKRINCADGLLYYRSLKRELVRAQEEIKRIQSVPLVIGQFMEAIDQKYGYKLNIFSKCSLTAS